MKNFGFVLIITLLAFSSASAIEINNRNSRSLGEVYGFVIAQDASLDAIVIKYPELARDVLLAGLDFERTFGDVESRLQSMFSSILGKEETAGLRLQLLAQNAQWLQDNPITKDIALVFLEEVRNRAKGEIHSPVLEYLLALRFSDNPAKELIEGFRQSFKTDGSGKSQGLVLNLQLPRSWKEKEASRPHIVRKWQSEGGTGPGLIMLMVRDSAGENPSRTDIAEWMLPGEIETLVPDGGVLRDHGLVMIENQPGYFMDFEMLNQRAGAVVFQIMRQYSVFYRGKMVSIHCAAGALESQHINVDEEFQRIKPLCQQVVNTLVIPELYTPAPYNVAPQAGERQNAI